MNNMKNIKKKKGKREKRCAGILEDFMEKYSQNPNSIASGIRATQKSKFTAHTISRWLKDEKTLSFEKWDEIELYMNFIIDKEI